MAELIHKGSVKDVYRAGPGEIEFVFSDRISVFDVPIPDEIPGKGEVLCAMASHWFARLSDVGIPHHFVARSGTRSMRVKSVEQVASLKDRPKPWRQVFIPLECIQRHYVAGSLNDRLQKGTVRPEDLGFPSGTEHLPVGARLPHAFFEMSTKFEATDRLLSRAEAMALSGLGEEDVAAIKVLCGRIDSLIAEDLTETSVFHVDGKKEFGFDERGRLMVVDVFGTLDEDRFWDRAAYDAGRTVDLSKEHVRQYYRSIGYKTALDMARTEGKPDPKIPHLPADLIEEVSALYRRIASEVTGKTF